MKFIGHIVSFVVKLAMLAAGIVLVLELIDNFSEENSYKYMVSEDFEA